jgi:hypothetical protein
MKPPFLLPLLLIACSTAKLLKPDDAVVECDIAVAGGSTASLAAAITAAEAAPELTICFTEITDWPGGQLTAGGVPAIDFGPLNRFAENQPRSFRSFVGSVRVPNITEYSGQGPQHHGNRGACSVSTTCFLPGDAISSWIEPRLRALPNLRLFTRTVVTRVTRDPRTGRVASLSCVQRSARDPAKEWSQPLSAELRDWYSTADSPMFTKTALELRSRVFIEATELADVLLSARPPLPWAQGVETPYENSTTTDSTCGQAATLTFYMELRPPVLVPPGPLLDAAAPRNDSWPSGVPLNCFGACARNFSKAFA